jgi:hypothetical protein
LERKFILFYIQEPIDVFRQFFFKDAPSALLHFMSLNFFKFLVQLSFTKNQFLHFAPQPFRPTLPYTDIVMLVMDIYHIPIDDK